MNVQDAARVDTYRGSRDYDPMSSLYRLFDHQTAKTFHDLSHHWLALDASRII
jgi:hypothetical protein